MVPASTGWFTKPSRDPAGADTLLPTLSAGVSAGDNLDESIRYNHSWRGVNQPNLVILDTLALFETIFGAVPSLPPAGAGADPVAVLRARQRVSVLDAVMADYRHVMSDAGGYSPSVRATIANHLDTVRELERRAVAIQLSLSGQGPTLAAACRIAADGARRRCTRSSARPWAIWLPRPRRTSMRCGR